jgi:hypothetical protein
MADIKWQLMRVLRSELDKGSKVYLIALLACADDRGEGEPGQDRLGELCTAKKDALAEYRKALNGPSSPVVIHWTRGRELANGERATDKFRIVSWKQPDSEKPPQALTRKNRVIPQKARQNPNAEKPPYSEKPPPLLSSAAQADAAIEGKEKPGNGLDGLPREVEEDAAIGVAAFVPDAAQVKRAEKMQGGNTAALQEFAAYHEKKCPGATHTQQAWLGFYDWWLEARPAALRQAAARAARASTPKPKRGPAATQAPPPPALLLDEATTRRLMAALPDYTEDEAQGVPRQVSVARDINEPHIVAAIKDALQVATITPELRDAVLAAAAA